MWYIVLTTATSLAGITNPIAADTNTCRVTNRKFWDFMEWFYGRKSNVHVTHIVENAQDSFSHYYPDVFINAILRST